MNKIIAIFLFVVPLVTTAQVRNHMDHKQYLKKLEHAKDSFYTDILRLWDVAIKEDPGNSKLRLERCKFIQHAFYDEYDDYNPNFDDALTCAEELIVLFPSDPECLIYKSEFLYGEEAISYLEELRDKMLSDDLDWSGYDWIVMERLATKYHVENRHQQAIEAGRDAMNYNDTLDLSLLIARSLKAVNKKEEATKVLVWNLDDKDGMYKLNQKAELLLELGATEDAVRAFEWALRDTSASYFNNHNLVRLLQEHGRIVDARAFLQKQMENAYWNKAQAVQKLFLHDLTYGHADSAEVNYRRLVEGNFANDLFGIYRIRLMFKAPALSWTIGDAGRVLVLVLLVVGLLIIPYLWILPIYSIGRYFKDRGTEFKESVFPWTLRHFWIACSLWLIADIGVMMIFNYEGILATVSSLVTEEELPAINKLSADLTLSFFILILIITCLFLRKEDWVRFYANFKANKDSLWLGLGLALGLRLALIIVVLVLNATGINAWNVVGGINESILSINHYYHPLLTFLFIVILVPFYEEVLFRGLMISACERYMHFIYANILQSLLFAFSHQELKLFVFYFAFGMIAGYFRQRRQSLVVSTSMHMFNNLFAFLILLSRS